MHILYNIYILSLSNESRVQLLMGFFLMKPNRTSHFTRKCAIGKDKVVACLSYVRTDENGHRYFYVIPRDSFESPHTLYKAILLGQISFIQTILSRKYYVGRHLQPEATFDVEHTFSPWKDLPLPQCACIDDCGKDMVQAVRRHQCLVWRHSD